MLPLADELAVEQSTRGYQVQYGTYCMYFQGDFATVRYWVIQYGMDVMGGGGGRGFQDNVHWTLFKIFLICRRSLSILN